MYLYRKGLAVVLALGTAAMLAAPSLADQPGQKPPAEEGQPGSGFVPSAGYLRTFQALDIQRRLAAQADPMFNLVASLVVVKPVSGTRLIPVLCVEFPNRGHIFTTSQHRDTLFDPAGPRPNPPLATLTQYYRDISQGKFTPNGEVFGWFSMPQNDTFYEDDGMGHRNGLNQRMGDLLKSTFDQADTGIDFGRFDNDGPDGLPNSGDDDGIVDTVFLIHPEIGGEIGNGVNGNIWSHSFQYSKYAAHVGQAYTTNDTRHPSSKKNPGFPFVRIEDYTIQPGLSDKTSSSQAKIIEIGVFCHEFGHALGLPDLYARPGAGTNSEGIGHYCLMASGSYGADDMHPETPVHMSAWSKAALGWANIRPIVANGPIALTPVQESNTIYNFDVPGTGGREFFLVEYRAPLWNFNQATQRNWDSGFSPGGLAIWHVDENIGRASASWPFAPLNQGQNDAPSLPSPPLPNFTNPHAMVALMQADRQLNLEQGAGRGDASDLHGTGSAFADDATCVCGSRGYAGGTSTGFSLSGINLASGVAVASVNDFPGGPPTPAPAQLPNANAVAAQIPVATVDAKTAASIKRFEPMARKLAQQGIGGLSSEDRKHLASASLAELKISFPVDDYAAAQKVASAERTTVVDARFTAHSPVEEAAKAIADLSRTKSALVTFAPPSTGVEPSAVARVSQLAVPTGGRSPIDDAAYRVADDATVKALIGTDLKLVRDHHQTGLIGNFGVVRYSQLIKVNNQDVPLSCHGVNFAYRDGVLTEIDSNVLPTADLKVTGTTEAFTEKAATTFLAKKLGLPESRIVDATSCVYLVNGQPDQARAIVKLKVDSGGSRPPIEVFLDQQTQRALNIQ